MKKYSILLGYIDKQMTLINRLYAEVIAQDVAVFECRYVFALKTQQLYTAIEDLFKQVAKAFENNIEQLGSYHKELLNRLYTEVPGVRPALLSKQSFLLLDKVRAFRHFIRHAYDCELNQKELEILQEILSSKFAGLQADIETFRAYVTDLADQ